MAAVEDDPKGPYRWVLLAALAAFAVRLVGLLRPVRADEAGFTLVARAWHAGPDSLYGAYFVDRPPSLIALFKLSDAVGGPLAIRVLGAVSCFFLVLLAAWVARLLGASPVPVAWTAWALVATPVIDVVAVTGEVLSLPLALAAVGLALRARSPGWAFAAGLVAALPLGLKQNLGGAVVFVLVLLALRRPRLLAYAVAGAALPVLATVGWALAAGVRLETLWYAVYGFRADATAALGWGSAASQRRLAVLVVIVVVTGIAAVLAAYLWRLRSQWHRDRALTAAVVAMVGVDAAALAAGGSFWQDYAFGLVPGALLTLALLDPRARRWLARFAVASAVVCLVGWGTWNLAGQQELDESDTGVALAAVADSGDTLVVFGGRADLQLESSLPSPYRYLWSLPMRALDPSLTQLRALVTGPKPPTWLVEWWPFDTWNASAGSSLRADVEQRYVAHGEGCGGRTIWLLRDTERGVPAPSCHR